MKPSFLSFISRLSKRERIIFYCCAFVAAAVLLDRVFLSPIFSRIDQLNEEIELKEETVRKSLLTLNYEDRILSQRDQYNSYLREPQSEEKEITAFLKEAESLAKQSSVYLIDIKPTDKVVQNNMKQYFLRMDFEAQMDQVLNFFHSIATSDQLLKIERFQLRPKTEGSSIVYCSMSIFKTIITK